jgi:hypothetical protein
MERHFLGSLILWRKKGANVLFSLEKNVKEVEKHAEVYVFSGKKCKGSGKAC